MSANKMKYRIEKGSDVLRPLPQPQYDNLLYYLTSAGHEYLNPSYYMERSDVDLYMINYIVQGEGFFTYKTKVHKLNKGDLCFAYLGEPSIFYPASDDLEIYFFHIKGSQIGEFYRTIIQNKGIILNNFPLEIVADTFTSIRTLFQATPDFYEVSSVLTRFLLKLLQLSDPSKNIYPPFILKIFQTVLDHPCTVEQLAQEMGFHAVYLERQFKRYTNKTLRQFLAERKLELAQNLLLTTDLSIFEIAIQLGYADSNGLIALFRKELGLTPLTFRKSRGKKYTNK